MKKEQLKERIEEEKIKQDKPYLTAYHKFHKGFLNGYEFVLNKKSKDGTSKANIRRAEDKNKVWGVCYEMDQEAFDLLKEFEKGYNPGDFLIETDKNELIISKTFISSNNSDKPPDRNYIKKIIDGAKEMTLPEEYISFIINHAETLSKIDKA